MKEEAIQVVIISFILTTAVIGGWYAVSSIRQDDPTQNRYNMKIGNTLPVIWIYLNDSEVNSRKWTAFEERSARVINLPFLNLCYESCVKVNGLDYRVEVIGGLSDLAVRMGSWEALPSPLRNTAATVREPELNWIRAAVLAKWGGLWVSPATIWIKPMGKLPKDKVIFFGSDDEVSFVGTGGTKAPSLRVVWSPIPAHPVWTEWEEKVRARLENRTGGGEFRRDSMSDAMAASMHEGVEIRPTAELTRKGVAGRRIQLEDLLAVGHGGDLPFDIKCEAKYVPIPWPELEDRRAFGWFLRLSEEQILESDMSVSWILRGVLRP